MNKRTSDEGASLIFAMLIITTIAVVVVALLTQGSSSLRVTLAVRSVADSSYSADGAAQIALNNIRMGVGFSSNTNESGFNNGSDGAGCFGNNVGIEQTDSMTLPSSFFTAYGGSGAKSAYIECAGEAGTGQQGTPVLVSASNKPGQAILTLDASLKAGSSRGLDFGQSSETNTIHGAVTSDSGISVKNNSYLNVTGNGVAINAAGGGGCSNPSHVTLNGAATTCGATSLGDPSYAAPATAPSWPQTPSCPSGNGGPEIFYPGVYTSTPDTTGVGSQTITVTVTKGSSGTFSIALTAPAGYSTVGSIPWNVTPASLQTSLQNAWAMSSLTVSGTQTTATVDGSYAITFPGILGTTPTITVTGTGLGSGKKVQQSVTTAGKASCTKTPGWYYFAPASSLTTGVYYFNWSGQWSTSTAMVGGVLSTKGDGTTAGGTSISPGGAAAAPTAPGACVNPIKDPNAVGDEFVFGGTAGFHPSTTSLKEFCATYSSSSIPTVVYGLKAAAGTAPAPVVPAQATCTASSSCSLVLVTQGDHAVVYFEGFVYAPNADIELDVNNATQPFFNFGLITNTLHVGQTGNGCATCAYINLPDNSPGYGYKSTIADLTVYLCNSPTCTKAAGTVALKVRVQFYDSTGSPASGAILGQRGVNILSWSEQK